MSRPMHSFGTLFLAGGLLLLAACSSTPEPTEPTPEPGDPKFRRLTVMEKDKSMPRRILDLSRAQVGYAKLTADLPRAESKRKLEALHTYLTDTASKHLGTLTEVLAVGNELERSTVAWTVGFSRDVTAIPPLVNALRDPSPLVVKNACLGFWTLNLPQIPTGPLYAVAKNHVDRGCRSNAVMALSGLANYHKADKEYKDFLFTRLREGDDPRVRLHSLDGLRHLVTEADIAKLAPLKHDPTPRVRWALTGVLWSTKSRRAIPHLIDLVSTREPNANVRVYASKYLKSFSGGVNMGKDESAWRRVFAEELKKLEGGE